MTDTVVVPPAAVAGDDPAHAAAMAAKVDEVGKKAGAEGEAAAAPAASKPARPDHIPEKFWDADKGVVKTDEMAKSYVELEKKQGQKPDDEAAKKAAAEEEAKKAAESAAVTKLDLTPFEAEYAEKGALTDESYKTLEAKGISREMVDNYIAGRIATAAQYETTVLAESGVGSREKYDAMTAWAKVNLKSDELAAFNKAVVGTKDEAVLAVSGIYARFAAAVGSDPSLLQGGTGQAAAGVFRSVAEHKAAIRDPRYKSDPAYRAEVESKLARSDIY